MRDPYRADTQDRAMEAVAQVGEYRERVGDTHGALWLVWSAENALVFTPRTEDEP